ncbi:MAG: hypothetical protein VYB05_08395 [Pseudomonadota bacterium]|nr:hypothetical protein [Pseudomonadota bacterium]
MISELRVAKAATFHQANRPLSNAAIVGLFRSIRGGHPSAANNLFEHRRVVVGPGPSCWSAISFLYDRPPAFFAEGAGVNERICGFLLLVEHRGHVAIFKSRLEVPAAFAARYLRRVSPERVDIAVARQDAVFEKIRLRNMSLSKHAMRNKTFEADDLRNVVGPAASRRYVPQGYSVRSGTNHFSTTPSTGRIAQRSDRVDHLALVDYAQSVIDELVDGVNAPAAFIGTFARAVDLATAAGAATPLSFGVDVAGLADAIFEREEIRLVRTNAGVHQTLTQPQVEEVLDELASVLEVRPEGKLFGLHALADGARVGAMALNKTRIALRALLLPLSADVEVESTAYAVGQDDNRLALRRYLDSRNGFIVLFDDLALAYIDGVLFRDEGLADGGAAFLRYLRTDPLLDAVTDEKGTFTPAHTVFDPDSTFGVVVNSVAAGDDVLVCDDLGDEWADFIGLNSVSSPRRISFYHAKHGDLSLGAGPFHVSVSQAMKNLGRMSLPAEPVARKLPGWRMNYVSGSGVRTAIPKIARGTAADLEDAFEQARNAPDAIRRVFIVTSSLSRAAVEATFADIATGGRPDPYFVQLYWLVLSYVSACSDMNAFGYVVCRP